MINNAVMRIILCLASSALVACSVPGAGPGNLKSAGLSQSESDYLAWQQAYFLKKPFVQDAIRRWADKSREPTGGLSASRFVEIMEFPNKTCVQLAFKDASVGGVPIYCYRVNSDRSDADFALIEEFSDTE